MAMDANDGIDTCDGLRGAFASGYWKEVAAMGEDEDGLPKELTYARNGVWDVGVSRVDAILLGPFAQKPYRGFQLEHHGD